MGAIIGILLFGSISTMGCIWEDEEEDMWDNYPILYGGWHTEWINRTENNDYQLSFKCVANARRLYLLAKNVTFTVYDIDVRVIPDGSHRLSDVYEKPIDDDNNYSFNDRDDDGYLSMGDFFILKSRDHVKDDGKLSPGPVEEGFMFELRCGPDGKDGRLQLGETRVR